MILVQLLSSFTIDFQFQFYVMCRNVLIHSIFSIEVDHLYTPDGYALHHHYITITS